MMWLFLRMLLTTGARRSEVNNLRWRDVNLADSIAILPTTKNGHARALPLVSDVKVALAAAAKVSRCTPILSSTIRRGRRGRSR